MTPHELIESYVAEVAMQLPRKQRNDVAFELRALLREELQARVEASGRGADEDLALEILRAFGPPSEVAARYRPALTIIDPADGRAFLRAAVAGMAILWVLGLLTVLRQPIDSVSEGLGVLGQWWVGTVLRSLWWPGVLVVYFGLAAWVRRRRPRASEWRPRAAAGGRVNRGALMLGLVGMLYGVSVLLDPRWLLEVFLGGRAAPAAYEALTYTDSFRRTQAPWLLGLLLLNAPVMLAAIVKGRRSLLVRRLESGLALATCAVLAWTVLDGPVLIGEAGDRTARFLLALIVGLSLVYPGLQLFRRVRPAPGPQVRA